MLASTAMNRKILWFVIVVFTAVSFTWSERLSSLGIILLAIHWFCDKNWQHKISTFRLSTSVVIMWSFFLMHLIALCWSPSLTDGWQSVQVKLSFLILPILFTTENYLNEKRLQQLMKVFALSCVLSFVYTFVWSYIHFHSKGWEFVTSRMNLSMAIMHPGYYSNYFAFAFVWAVFEIFNHTPKQWTGRIMLIALISFLLIAIFLLISKTVVLFLVLFLLAVCWMLTRSIKTKNWRLGIYILLLGAGAFMIDRIPKVRERIQESISSTTQIDKDIPLANSTGSRIVAWQNEWTLIKEHWLFGYGTGAANSELKAQLQYEGFNRLADDNMHTHNQVFHTWLDLGILGPLLMIIWLVAGAWIFYNRKNSFAFWLIPLITMNMLTDDMLEVQAGVVFFLFFMNLFLYRPGEKITTD